MRIDATATGDDGLERLPFLELPPFFPGRIVPDFTDRVCPLPLESRLQQPLRQLLEQTARTRRLKALGPGPGSFGNRPSTPAGTAPPSGALTVFSLVTGATLHDRSYTVFFTVPDPPEDATCRPQLSSAYSRCRLCLMIK
ncbi:hypothetical protein [Streptomyces sp. NBC_01077]|uniref:hypothetical protein n=1 Tax=Streptomyces sp. NBC_01077 TaxID=2903746 RepID=UPI0038669DA4